MSEEPEKTSTDAKPTETTPPAVFDSEALIRPPVLRAAYSDRTAWLMAAMSELAYYRFEGGKNLQEVVKDLMEVATESPDNLEQKLKSYLNDREIGKVLNKDALACVLETAGFELINVYNKSDTQAFLAKREAKTPNDGLGMRVLVFRGTEKTLGDIKADAAAKLVTPAESSDEKIHEGFYDAFVVVRSEIEKDLKRNSDLPLYITGHSLGGALATVATRFIASDSVGACYTFGGPRVGNTKLQEQIKTPIYRVVNAADVVPRLPPAYVVPLLIAILNWVPLPLGWLSRFLEKFHGYVHFGDMRYLTDVVSSGGDKYAGLKLISNPSLPLRVSWWARRMIFTFGRAAYWDHSISSYRDKLRAYAIGRQSRPPGAGKDT